MKRSLSFLIFVFLLSAPMRAGTDQKLSEFLKKLNAHYYNLPREGLKNFECVLNLELSEGFKNFISRELGRGKAEMAISETENLRFILSYNGKEPPVARLDASYDNNGLVNGDREGDFSKRALGMINDNMLNWYSTMIRMAYETDLLAKYDYKIQKTPEGYQVLWPWDKSVTTYTYDKKWKLLTVSVSEGPTMISLIRWAFTADPKGWLLSGYDKSEWIFTQGPKGLVFSGAEERKNDFMSHCVIENQLIEKFWLPKTFGPLRSNFNYCEFTVKFSDYKINGEIKQEAPE